MKIILTSNGPFLNRGCEAITRGTIEIISELFPVKEFVAISFFPNRKVLQEQANAEDDSRIRHLGYIIPERYSYRWILFKIDQLLKTNIFGKILYAPLMSEIKDASFVLSLGGDNYSSSYSLPYKYMNIDKLVLKSNKKVFIWGASVGPFNKVPSFEKKFVKHLNRIGGVFAREDISYNYLRELGVRNVYRISDPAVLMKPQEINDLQFDPGKFVGLNFSPLMARYVTGNNKLWEDLVYDIVVDLLENTNLCFVLVPHVFALHTSDLEFMNKLFTRIRKLSISDNRLIIIEKKYKASELKWIISKLMVFAGSRTHSTIAALSSNVPTLSFAYSEKAFGINRDFYGHTLYCLEGKEICPERIRESLKGIVKDRAEIQRQLSCINEKIISQSRLAGEILLKSI